MEADMKDPRAIPFEDQNLTDTYIRGSLAQSRLVDHIERILGLTDQDGCDVAVACDSYDWSLEIYVGGRTPEQIPITEAHARGFVSLGCTICWVNYCPLDELGYAAKGRRYAEVPCFHGAVSPLRRRDQEGRIIL